jgi:PBP1b-binding outer membrane lipoprotein LpoB
MKKLLFSIMFLMLLVTACSEKAEEQPVQSQNTTQAQPMQYVLGSNDWSVITSRTPDAKILEAYQYTIENPDPLAHIPCYCGCYELDGHTSVRDCFVDSVDGKIVNLDNMGFG